MNHLEKLIIAIVIGSSIGYVLGKFHEIWLLHKLRKSLEIGK